MTEICQNVRGWAERTALPRNVREKRLCTANCSLAPAAWGCEREKETTKLNSEMGKTHQVTTAKPHKWWAISVSIRLHFSIKKNPLIYEVFTLLKLWRAKRGLGPSRWASNRTYKTNGFTFNQNSVSRETDVLKWELFYQLSTAF